MNHTNTDNLYKKIARNALFNWGFFVLGVIITFFMSPFLVHTLGDMKYGIWSLIGSLSGYMLLLDLGIGSSLTRYVSKFLKIKDNQNLVSFINSAIALYMILGLMIILVSPLTANLLLKFIKFDIDVRHIVHFLVIIVSVDAATFLIVASLRSIFQGLQRYDIINLVFCLLAIIKAFCFYLFLSNGFGLLSMGIIALTANLTIVIIFYLIIKINYGFIHFNFKTIERTSIKSIYNYSLFTFINMIANLFIYKTDSFVIGYFLSTSAITYYSISWSLMEYLKKFGMAFSSVFVPVISEYEAVSDYDKIRGILNRGTKYTLVLTMPLCVGVMIFGEPFISLWMGKKYATVCSPILIILIICQFLELPQKISNSVLFGISWHYNTSVFTLWDICSMLY